MLDVILEDGLRCCNDANPLVSILIVLDVILEVVVPLSEENQNQCFNPYCVGCNLRRFFGRAHAISESQFQSLLCWM